MNFDYAAGWFAVLLSLTIAGVLVIRVVALRAERRIIAAATRAVAIHGSAIISIDRTLSPARRAALKLRVLEAVDVYPQPATTATIAHVCGREFCGHTWDDHELAPGPKACLRCGCHGYRVDPTPFSPRDVERVRVTVWDLPPFVRRRKLGESFTDYTRRIGL